VKYDKKKKGIERKTKRTNQVVKNLMACAMAKATMAEMRG